MNYRELSWSIAWISAIQSINYREEFGFWLFRSWAQILAITRHIRAQSAQYGAPIEPFSWH